MKKNIFFIFNIIVLLAFFIVCFIYHNSASFYGHDYSLPFEFNAFNLRAPRVPAFFLNYLYCSKLPQIFNMHPVDFRTNIIVASIFSILYLCIVYFFSKGFYLFCPNSKISFKEILFRKEHLLIFPISFFILDVFVFSHCFLIFKDFEQDAVIHIYDMAEYIEYNFPYIVFFPFLFLIFDLFVNNKILKRKEIILYSIVAFFVGFWCEIVNLMAFFCIFISGILLLFYDMQKLKKKTLVPILLSYLLGFCLVYFVFGKFDLNHVGSFGEYSIIDHLHEHFSNLSLYLTKFWNIYFVDKTIYWTVFVLLFISIKVLNYKNDKNTELYKNINVALILIFSVLSSVIITYLLSIPIANARYDQGCVFERDHFQLVFINIFTFLLVILMGIIYYNGNRFSRKILLYFLLTLFLYYSILFSTNYISQMKERYNRQKLQYKIEKSMVVYSSLNEAVILPNSLLDNTNNYLFWRIFPVSNMYAFERDENFPFVLRNNYIDGGYLLYNVYYNFSYIHPIVGAIFADDEYSEKQLKIRESLYGIADNHHRVKFANIKNYDKYPNNGVVLDPVYSLKHEADICYNNKNIQRAIDLYHKYLNIVPDDFDVILKLGRIFEEIDDIDSAIEIYQKLYLKDKSNLTFIYKLMNAYFRNGEYIKALKLNSIMLEKEDAIINLYLNQIMIYKVLNMYDKLNEFMLNIKNSNIEQKSTIEEFYKKNKDEDCTKVFLLAPVM